MKKALIKTLLILSPLLVSWLAAFIWITFKGPGGQEALGVMSLMMLFLGIPFVAFTGLSFSFLTRKRVNSSKLSYYGYLAPAILTWIISFGMLA